MAEPPKARSPSTEAVLAFCDAVDDYLFAIESSEEGRAGRIGRACMGLFGMTEGFGLLSSRTFTPPAEGWDPYTVRCIECAGQMVRDIRWRKAVLAPLDVSLLRTWKDTARSAADRAAGAQGVLEGDDAPGYWIRCAEADVRRFSDRENRAGYLFDQQDKRRLVARRQSRQVWHVHFRDPDEHEQFRAFMGRKPRRKRRRKP